MENIIRYRYSRLKETNNENGQNVITLFINIRKIKESKIENQIISEQIVCGPTYHIEKPASELPLSIQQLPDVEDRYYVNEEEYLRLESLFESDVNELIEFNPNSKE
ncbi:MAG: hypothetical protein ABS939_00715 [Psychrobacillus sp.]